MVAPQTDTATEKWLQALGMLYEACEPLTYDCILTEEDSSANFLNIQLKTLYCMHVKCCIDDGIEPLSWDEWTDVRKRTEFEEAAIDAQFDKLSEKYRLDNIDVKGFQEDLTRMFK